MSSLPCPDENDRRLRGSGPSPPQLFMIFCSLRFREELSYVWYFLLKKNTIIVFIFCPCAFRFVWFVQTAIFCLVVHFEFPFICCWVFSCACGSRAVPWRGHFPCPVHSSWLFRLAARQSAVFAIFEHAKVSHHNAIQRNTYPLPKVPAFWSLWASATNPSLKLWAYLMIQWHVYRALQ